MKLTPSLIVAVVKALLRKVPPRIRQWVYLATAVAAVVVLVATWVQQGLTWEQIGYLLVGLVGSMAGANVKSGP